ncbi:DUF366 family protein [bacterium]|nr:DUF366 family protein [bacterium]
MNTLFCEENIKYTGKELSPHWILTNFKMYGDSIVSFVGEVDVPIDNMVDVEDRINNEPIYAKSMLNFIIEHFDYSIKEITMAQILFVQSIKEVFLNDYNIDLKRNGDDLFYNGRKLSVSIATKSIVSGLIHTALNIDCTGAPVSASDINEIGIKDVKTLAQKIMKCYSNNIEKINYATTKVKGVF